MLERQDQKNTSVFIICPNSGEKSNLFCRKQEGNIICLKIIQLSDPFGQQAEQGILKKLRHFCGLLIQVRPVSTSLYHKRNCRRPAWFLFGFLTFKPIGLKDQF